MQGTILRQFRRATRPFAALAACFSMVFAPLAVAGPQGAQVIKGNVVFYQDGNLYIIKASNKSIINFSSFNIGPNEKVKFIQPNEWAKVLNKITGPGPTQIDGALTANGIVYLVNPAGVIFGKGSTVDVAGIYAAAGSISDKDFLKGKNHFTGVEGSVVNNGDMHGDFVSLIGKYVGNHGSIISDKGMISMLAGNDIVLGKHDGKLFVKIDGKKLTDNSKPLKGTSSPDVLATPGVENTGVIKAKSGQVVIGAGDWYSLAVKNSGSIQANQGDITVAAADGAIQNLGDITANAINGKAGSITVQGPSVVNQGVISADSTNGQAGYVEVTSRDHTFLLDGSLISAAGLEKGFGGEVLIHSYNGLTKFESGAVVDVSGGATSGHAGYVEVSGKNLDFHGYVDLTAAKGSQKGQLLIDPHDITIGADNDDDGLLDDPGSSDVNAVIEFNEPDETTDVLISAAALEAITGSITLVATNDIFVNTEVNLTNNNSVLLEAFNNITLTAAINGANNLTLTANSDNVGGGSLFLNVPLTFSGNGEFSGTQIFVGGDIMSVSSFGIAGGAGDVTFNNAVVLNADTIVAGDNVSFLSTVDSDGTPRALTVNSSNSGLTLFGDHVGTGDALLSLNTNADGSTEIDGDVTTTTGITLNDNAELTGVVNQTLDGGTGDIDAAGTLAKTGAGDLNLTAANVNLDQNTSVDAGNLDITGALTALQDLTAEGDVAVHDNATVGGDVTSNTGAVTFDGTSDIDGNVAADTDVLLSDDAIVSGDVTAGGNIDFGGTADVTGDVIAGTDVTSVGNATVDGNVTATAGNVDLQGTATVGGNVTAGGNIDFGDTADVTGDVLADDDVTVVGNATVDGSVTATNGNVHFQGTSDVGVNVSAGTDALFDQDTTVGGDVTAGGSIDFGGTSDVTGNVVADADVTAGGNATVDGNVTATTGNIDFQGTADIGGNVSAGNNAAFDLDATVGGDVTAGGQIDFAQQADVTGEVLADGDINIGGVATIGGDVDSDSASVTFSDNAFLSGDVFAALNITFNGNATMQGVGAQIIRAEAGLLQALADVEKTTSGSLALGGATGIELSGATSTSNGDLTFEDDAEFVGAGDQQASAGGSNQLIAQGNLDKTTAGALTLQAGDNIELQGNVSTSDGDLVLDADADFAGGAAQSGTAGGAGSQLLAQGNITKSTTGNLDLSAAGGIVLDGDAETSDGNLTFNNDLTLQNATNHLLSANDGTLWAKGLITKTNSGNLALFGATMVDLDGNVVVTNGNFASTGGDFSSVGAAISAGEVSILHDADVLIGGSITASDNLLVIHSGDDGSGNLTFGPGVFLQSNDIQLLAGDGAGGATTAFVDLLTDSPEFRGSGGAGTSPTDFAWGQDASINDLATASASQFAGGLAGLNYSIESFDGSVTIDDASKFALSNLDIAAALDINFSSIAIFDGADRLNNLTAQAGGFININTSIITTDADQDYQSAVVLGENVTLNGSTVNFDSTVDADLAANNRTLTVNATTTTFADNVGSGEALDILTTDANGTTTIGGNVITQNGILLQDAVSLNGTGGNVNQTLDAGAGALDADQSLTKTNAGDVTLAGDSGINVGGDVSTTNGDLTFENDATLDGGANQIVTAGGTGALDFDGSVAKTTANLNLIANGGISVGGIASTGNGDLTFEDDVTFDGVGDQFADASNGALAFNGTTTKSTAGNFSLFGTNGITADDTISVTSGDLLVIDNLTFNGTAIDGSGSLTFFGDFNLGNDAAVSSSGGSNIQFVQAINGGGFSLDLNTGGVTQFDGIVDLGALTTDAGGSTQINGGSITSSGAQIFNDDVELGANTTLTGSTIAFNGNLNSLAGNFTLDVTGDTTFGDANTDIVGSAGNELGHLTVLGTSDIFAGSVNTLNHQTYDGVVSLHSNVTLASAGGSSPNGDITFVDDVLGAFLLTVNTAGNTTFGGGVDIDSLVTDAGGQTHINGGGVQTANTQTYGDDVVLGADADLVSTGGSDIVLAATVTGPHALNIDTAGLTNFNGTVDVGSVHTLGGGTTNVNGGSITTTGDQLFEDAVALGGAAAFESTAGGDIHFDSTVDDAGSGFDLSVLTSGDTTFDDTVTVNSVTTDAGGNTNINGGSVQTAGTQTYGDDVTLGQDTTLTGDAGVTFNGNVDGDDNDLTINASAGSIVSDGDITGVNTLDLTSSASTTIAGILTADSLSVDAGTDAVFGDDVTVANSIDVTSGGLTSFDGPIAADSMSVTAGGDAEFFGSIDIVNALEVESAGGDVQFGSNSDRIDHVNAGNITVNAELGTLDFNAKFIESENDVAFTADLIDLNVNEISAQQDVLFDTNRTAGEEFASIISRRNLIIEAEDGDFVMTENDKFTVLGNLNIRAKNAFLSDITTTGNMTIVVNDGTGSGGNGIITILLRDPAVAGPDGEVDLGVDFVAGGEIQWAYDSLEKTGGSGKAFFATPSGIIDIAQSFTDDNNQFFSQLAFEDREEFTFLQTLDIYSDFFANPNLLQVGANVYDLRGQGPTDTNIADALAGAIPQETSARIIQDRIALSKNERAMLAALNIDIRDWPESDRPIEEDSRSSGKYVYEDVRIVGSDDQKVAEPRISRPMLLKIWDIRTRVLFAQDANGELQSRAPEIQQALSDAYDQYQAQVGFENATPEGFRQHVDNLDPQSDTSKLVNGIRDLLNELDLIGLNRTEIEYPRGMIVREVTPATGGLTAFIEKLFERDSATASNPGVSPPPVTKEISQSGAQVEVRLGVR